MTGLSLLAFLMKRDQVNSNFLCLIIAHFLLCEAAKLILSSLQTYPITDMRVK